MRQSDQKSGGILQKSIEVALYSSVQDDAEEDTFKQSVIVFIFESHHDHFHYFRAYDIEYLYFLYSFTLF
jgi:hypothetical protein